MPQAAIFFDDDLRAAANAAGMNYWHVYTRELLGQMGLPHHDLPRSGLRAERLAAYRVLILPDLEPKYLRTEEKQALRAWVEAGGLLIGFATGGLHDLFGVKLEGRLDQPDDAFTPTAALRYSDPALSRPLLPPGEEDTPLPVVAPVKLIGQFEGRELARLLSLSGRDLRRPAVTLRDVGAGQTLYCCFNVAHCLWAMHHGRPVSDDYDGDGKLTLSDAMVLRPFPASLPYADLLVSLLRQVIARRGLALIHTLPPSPEGDIPEALCHCGGADESTPGHAVKASGLMASLGLPCQVSLMPDAEGRFSLSRDEYDQIRANGHETSLLLNFSDGVAHPFAFTRRDVQRQVDWYVQAFGETPVCAALREAAWCGWAEPAQWLAGAGLLADSSRAASAVGFAFGTALPFFHHQDFHKDNDRLRFLAVPGGVQRGAAGEDASGRKVLHYGTEELTRWWLARSEARLERTEGGLDVECDWRSGCVVRMVWEGDEPLVTAGGQPCVSELREEQGTRWLYLAIPAGHHTVKLPAG